jgi:CDP-diacylglycerol--serine O-phosphatidyltransferase
MKRIHRTKYRYAVPNGITFISLGCGAVSILLSSLDAHFMAALLILASYILDLLDGYLARKLKATSAYGLQLDSLVDMASLGIAPAVLVFHHVSTGGINAFLIGPFVVLVILAGAFRLARFNLLPPKKTGAEDSVGLTISTGGATLALAVLTDLTWHGGVASNLYFIPLLVLISALMVSTIRFPSLSSILSDRIRAALLLVACGATFFFLPPFGVWFVWTLIFITVAVIRGLWRRLRGGRTS